MKKLIESYPSAPCSTEKFTKNSITDHLAQEKGLIKAMIDVKTYNVMNILIYNV